MCGEAFSLLKAETARTWAISGAFERYAERKFLAQNAPPLWGKTVRRAPANIPAPKGTS